MSDLEDEDLDLKPADAGALFRAEMWATNAILGYWPYLVGALVTVLLGFLFYGNYSDYVRNAQRAGAAAIAEVEEELPSPVEDLGRLKALNALPLPNEDLVGIADQLVETSKEHWGPAKLDGLLKAAEVYRIADATERRRTTLDSVLEEATRGSLEWCAAQRSLAALELQSEQGPAAVARLRDVQRYAQGYLAQQAMLALGAAYETMGEPENALQVYEEFLRDFSESPLLEEVNKRRDRVAG